MGRGSISLLQARFSYSAPLYERYADRIRSVYGFGIESHRIRRRISTVYRALGRIRCRIENRIRTVYDRHTVLMFTEPKAKTIYERYA